MKITIGCNGDNSVGIHGVVTVIDLGIELDDEFREHYRERFRALFAELWDDGSTWVVFGDGDESSGGADLDGVNLDGAEAEGLAIVTRMGRYHVGV